MQERKKIRIGSWITLKDTYISEIFSKSYDIDFVCIDYEHSKLSLSHVVDHIQIINLCGKKPFVRISEIEKYCINKILDAGAQGLIIPNIKSSQDIDNVVSHMFFPPKGTRGVGLSRAQNYGAKDGFNSYHTNYAQDLELVPMIENKEALMDIENILAHQDVQTIFIGPYDLSSSLGKPGDFNSKEFIDALDTIKKACTKYDCHMGIHLVEPNLDKLLELKSEGYSFLVYSTDFRILENSTNLGIS